MPILQLTDPSWGEFVARLTSAESEREQLAVCGAFLQVHQQAIRGALTPEALAAVDAVDPMDPSRADLFDELVTAPNDETAVLRLVRFAALLDQAMASFDDVVRGGYGADPEVVWGPFAPLGSSGMLLLLRWPRPARLPIDRQSVVPRIIRNFRSIGRGPGGLEWDLSELGGTPRQRRMMRALLGKSNWPLRIALWPGLDAATSCIRTDGMCGVVDPTPSESDLIFSDVVAAISFAEDQEAHILVLPELYVPRGRLRRIQRHLSRQDRSEYPVMSVLGLSHQPQGHKWRNEAVTLDYAGEVLWRHAKTAPFVTETGVGECLATGSLATFRYTPSGWFTVLLCLDLFAPDSREAVSLAAPNLVLAPSLSSSTRPHRNAAEQAHAVGIACAVANRPLGVARDKAPSFHTCDNRPEPSVLRGPAVAVWKPPG